MKVLSLHTYPVKSLRGLAHTELFFHDNGPTGDREFVITDLNGKFLTQRQIPEMGLISVEVQGHELHVKAPGKAKQTFGLQHLKEERLVKVWSDSVTAVALGEEADVFLSDCLGQLVRIFRYQKNHPRLRQSPQGEAYETRFSDQAQVLLTSMVSLQALRDRVNSGLLMERFRSNIVIDGVQAWEEEGWKGVRIGGVEMEFMRLCTRCVIITLDPLTAKSTHPELLTLLKDIRGPRPKSEFGVHYRITKPGLIRVGDVCEPIV